MHVNDCVETGIDLLDSEAPGWVNCIDLDTLDMSTTGNCVLGQVYGDFFIGMAELFASDDPELAVRHGFETPDETDPSCDYDALNEAWRTAIDNRLAP